MLRNERRRVLKQFRNCRILRDGAMQLEDLWVRDGRIVNPEKIFYDEKVDSDVKIDCAGALISPGFIDLQINGGFGVDFSYNENVEEGVNKVARGLLKHGVTSFCPTLVTSPSKVYHRILPRIKRRPGSSQGAGILGVHLEGPFISPSKKGAHPDDHIKTFNHGFKSVAEMYGDLDNVCMVTLAPEIPNAASVIEELCKRDIKVSIGHSTANIREAETAVKHGASFITHLFNAMSSFHHRDPGLVGLLTSNQVPSDRNVSFGIIADGIHVHPAALAIAYKSHPKGLVLVTDAISAFDLEQGIHKLGQFEIEIQGDSAYIAGTDTLCGSIASMSTCVKNLEQATLLRFGIIDNMIVLGCTVAEALETATLHPAKVLGIDSRKGVLTFDSDADFILLNEKLEILQTWIAGECVYDSGNGNIIRIDA